MRQEWRRTANEEPLSTKKARSELTITASLLGYSHPLQNSAVNSTERRKQSWFARTNQCIISRVDLLLTWTQCDNNASTYTHIQYPRMLPREPRIPRSVQLLIHFSCGGLVAGVIHLSFFAMTITRALCVKLVQRSRPCVSFENFQSGRASSGREGSSRDLSRLTRRRLTPKLRTGDLTNRLERCRFSPKLSNATTPNAPQILIICGSVWPALTVDGKD